MDNEAIEICNNAIDDDGDGLIDINDPDCTCILIEPISQIPNPSFEKHGCCPLGRSELSCAESWIQASEATTDYLNTCGWTGWEEYPPPLPFPDGNAVVGFRDGRTGQGGEDSQPQWKEYAGACLLRPLEKSVTYRMEFDLGFVNSSFSPPINITLFGTADCKYLPFGKGNQYFGCPTNGGDWQYLGSTYVSGGANEWVKAAIQTRPTFDVKAIAIGPACPPVNAPVNLYYYFDNLLLADNKLFEDQIKVISHPCKDNFSLEVEVKPNVTYQWYKNGIALVKETSPKLSRVYGEGEYQVRLIENNSCSITPKYNHKIPVYDAAISRTICKDATYNFGKKTISESGTYIDTFKNSNNCDSIVVLRLKKLGDLFDTVQAKLFEGEAIKIGNYKISSAGDHVVNLKSVIGCDSTVFLQLEHYNAYFSNIFSASGQHGNDVFTLISDEGLIDKLEMSVYDRSGSKVYTGSSWDGKLNGIPVLPGVYTYIAKALFSDGFQKTFTGSVTLVD